LFELVRRQRASVNQLVLLGDPDSVLQVTPDVEKYRERAPDDPLPFIALAKSALDSNDPIAARRYARKVVETHPDEIEAWAILGRSLAQLPDEESAFRKWHRQVPQPA